MTYRRRATALCAAALTTMPLIGAAHAKYSFTRIADDTGPLGEIGIAPVAINDDGQVAFLATLKTGQTVLLSGSGGPLTTVADTSTTFRTLGFGDRQGLTHGFPSIDGLGQVAFAAVTATGETGVFAGTDGAHAIVAPGVAFGFDGDVFSSGSGTLTTVEASVVIASRRGQAILAGSGGPPITIADTSGTFASLDADPRINGSGQVSFHAIRRDGSEGIFVGTGGPVTTIADTSGLFASFSDAPAISDDGRILFQATLKAIPGGHEIPGLFSSIAGHISLVADATGRFSSFGFAPAINAHGQIAFLGTTRSGQVGLFTGDDPERDRVIAIGDRLDGSIVMELSVLSFRTALNNRGQIAFIAQLTDGRTGIYRADADPRRLDDHRPQHVTGSLRDH